MSFSEMDVLIDKNKLENKDKLEKIHSKKIDKEQFSLKNKKGSRIYFLRKKSSKGNYKEDSDILSDKKISKTQKNLGEGQLEINDKNRDVEKKPEETNKRKRRIQLKYSQKNKETDDKIFDSPPIDKSILESEEIDEVIAEIEKHLEKRASKSVDKEPKDVYKKTLGTKDIVETRPSQGVVESEKPEVPKKRGFIKKKEIDEIQSVCEKETISEEIKKSSRPDVDVSVSKDPDVKEEDILDSEVRDVSESYTGKLDEKELSELFEKKTLEYDQKGLGSQEILEPSQSKDVERSEKPEVPKKRRLFKKKDVDWVQSIPKRKIKKRKTKVSLHPDVDVSASKESDVKVDHIEPIKEKEIEKPKKDLGASKQKLPFFKKKKSFDKKTIDFTINETGPKKQTNKPMFRVDNLPQKEKLVKDEAKLLDDKIKDSPIKSDTTPVKDQAELKAVHLVEKHFKERKLPKSDNEKELDILAPTGVLLTDEDAEHEHVFFDEEDSSFKGWTPKITEKDKEMALALTPQIEIYSDAKEGVGEIDLSEEISLNQSVKLTDLGFSEGEWEELDIYTLYEPFAYVEILKEKVSLDKCYFLVEIALTEEEEKLISFIRDTISSLDINTDELDEKGDDKYLLERLDLVIDEYNVKISDESRKKIYYYIRKTSLGLDKIDPLMLDPNIEDISCDGINVPVFLYHRKYGSLKSNIRFDGEGELSSFIYKLAQKCGKHISIAEPMLDATMPDGSRIQMTLSDEITAKGSTFTIRKFRDDPFSPPDLVEFNTMSSEMIAYMWLAVENGINTLFVGGTASGKTTALNALTLFIPRESKIVSIEETREINLPHPNWIPGISRSGFGEVVANKAIGEIDMYDLMKAALRQRPEYIIVGEIRGREAYVLFQAMATGHATYSTAHADSAQSLIHRLEGKPINIPRIMLQSLDIVCLHVITRVKDFRARRCKQIIEIIDIDPTTKEILTNEVFHWDPIEDKFTYSGKSYVLERIRAEKDMSREEMTGELKKRMNVVEWMNKNNIREFREVSKLVSQYNETPEETLKLIDKDVKK